MFEKRKKKVFLGSVMSLFAEFSLKQNTGGVNEQRGINRAVLHLDKLLLNYLELNVIFLDFPQTVYSWNHPQKLNLFQKSEVEVLEYY